jgi:DNA mismatch repair protein MutS2
MEETISRCLTPAGEVQDSASPELAAIRRQLVSTRQRLLQRLEGIMQSPRGRRAVQDPIITEREGRYVIPLKIDARREIRGIVHDVSNTGATVFLEPWATVEVGNELRELALQEQREVERILRDLSDRLGEHEEEIGGNIAAAADIDLILAKARFARRTRSTEPHLPSPADGHGMQLRLVNARHPLLGDRAVPLSVEIGRDFSVLVITGPNTGGKTVALKTIGLLSLMVQAGMPIPATAESRLPVFDGVFVDVGDEQSIEQTLSTFSWHVGNIVRILDVATPRSLVLLDELGTSTDPAQGSALARAILRHFLSLGATTVATTHFGDLKAFAHSTPGLENASLDFDPVTLAPTYHLTTGVPGGSNALATAARLGLPDAIIDDARGMLSRGSEELEDLLADLMAEKEQAEVLRQGLEEQATRAERQKTELEAGLERLRAQERSLIQDTRDRVVREAAVLQKDIRLAAARLKKEQSKEAVEQSRRILAAARDRLKDTEWRPEAGAAVSEPGEIRAGDTVWLKEAEVAATVLSISSKEGQVEVRAGPSRITLGLSGVVKVAPSRDPERRAIPPVTVPETAAVPRELNIIGKRVEEAEWLVEDYLDVASRAGLVEVRIVHGSGTGRLRDAVRERLARHTLVKSYRQGERGEGGNGATVVRL